MPAPERARVPLSPAAQRIHRYAVAAAQTQVAQRLRQLARGFPFSEIHGGARVHDQMDALLLLLHEQLEKQLFKARVGVPIHTADVVAHGIFAEVRKLHAAAQAARERLSPPEPPAAGCRMRRANASRRLRNESLSIVPLLSCLSRAEAA